MPRHNQTLVTKWSLCDIRVAQLESTYLVQKGNSKNSWRKLWANAHTHANMERRSESHEDQNQDNDNDELQSKQPNRQTNRLTDSQSGCQASRQQAAGNICHNWQRIYAMLIKGLWGKSFHPDRQTDTHTHTHTLGAHESCAKGEFHFLSALGRHRGREGDCEMTMLGVAQVTTVNKVGRSRCEKEMKTGKRARFLAAKLLENDVANVNICICCIWLCAFVAFGSQKQIK